MDRAWWLRAAFPRSAPAGNRPGVRVRAGDLLDLVHALPRTGRQTVFRFAQVSNPSPAGWHPQGAPQGQAWSPVSYSKYVHELVELRGFEPRTSCMPFLAESSGDVELSLGLAGQSGYSVWLRPAASEAVCVRSHLISHWYCGPPPQDVRLLANRISSAFMSIETSEAPRQPPKDQSRPLATQPTMNMDPE